MSQDPNHVDPLPAEGAPHAYAAVWRLNSPHADRPEWDERNALVVPEWDRERLDRLRALGYHLIPIGPDGDTGTRAITAPSATVLDVIEDPADLDALPVGSIVLAENQAWTLRWPGNGWTVCPSCEITYCAGDLLDYTGDSVTVLWTPGGSE